MRCIAVALAAAVPLALLLAAAADEKSAPHDNKPPEGFTLLFTGKDLANWKGLIDVKKKASLKPEELAAEQKKADEQLVHWKVEDGVIHFDGKGQNLQTARDYGDVELFVDWKIKEKGDSGIYLRGNPQVQIWDSDNLGDNLKEDLHTGSGGLWNNPKGSKGKQPSKKADKAVGEWNTFRIVMKGDKVTVLLNGEKVVDETPLSNYWEKDQPLPAKGPIELQSHGDELWFKNIYIKEL
jgi:hypothetical protein